MLIILHVNNKFSKIQNVRNIKTNYLVSLINSKGEKKRERENLKINTLFYINQMQYVDLVDLKTLLKTFETIRKM